VSGLSTDQTAAITARQLAAMTTGQIAALGATNRGRRDRCAGRVDDLADRRADTAQAAALTTDQIQALTNCQVAASSNRSEQSHDETSPPTTARSRR
jgi:hypothetical protein